MAILAWVMMGLAVWHFAIWVPDRFCRRHRRRVPRRDRRRDRLRAPRERAVGAEPRRRRRADGARGDPRLDHRHGDRVARGQRAAKAPSPPRPSRRCRHAFCPDASVASGGRRARPRPRLEIDPCDVAATLRLERELGVSGVLAQVLVRRGFADPGAARAWLAAEDRHDLAAFAGLAEAAALVRRHIADGGRITVHGDYDVDGMASTAILVRALRELGADVGWFLPSRTRGRLRPVRRDGRAPRRPRHAAAHHRGLRDHRGRRGRRGARGGDGRRRHRPPQPSRRRPAARRAARPPGGRAATRAPSSAARASRTCSRALLRDDDAERPEDLELVALATVADCVPLRGENRRLVRAGLRAMGTTRSEGLRALMKVAKADPARIDARAIGFRLAPRLNAAGRLYRADAGVELLLTGEAERARVIAEELDRANAERRHVEQRILFEAEGRSPRPGERNPLRPRRRGLAPGRHRDRRLAHRRAPPPAVRARRARRRRGHRLGPLDPRVRPARRAAGVRATHLAPPRRAPRGGRLPGPQGGRRGVPRGVRGPRDAVLRPEDLVPTQRVDAVVAGDELGMTLAEELERARAVRHAATPTSRSSCPPPGCATRGRWGRGVTCASPWCPAGARAQAVAFGVARVDCDARRSTRCSRRRSTSGAAPSPRGSCCATPCPARRPRSRSSASRTTSSAPRSRCSTPRRRSQAPDCRATRWATCRSASASATAASGGIAGIVAGLVHTGEPVLVVVADAALRARQLAADRRWPAPVLARRPACRSGPGRRRPRRRHRPAGDARRGGRPAGGRSWPDGPSGLGTRRTRMDSATPRA